MRASQFSDAQKAFILKQGAEAFALPMSAGRLGSARRRTSTGRPSMVRPRFARALWLLNRVVCINLSGLFVERRCSWP